MSNVGRCVTGGFLLLLAGAAWADVAGDYQGLFGEKEKEAIRKGPKAQVELAAELLGAVKSVSGQKDLQALLCEKAYEFGMKAPAGYKTAADAVKLLMVVAPDNKAAAEDKLLAVARLRFAKSAPADRKQLGSELVDLLIASGDERVEAKEPAEAVAFYRQALPIAAGGVSGRTKEINEKIQAISAAQEGEKKVADLKARLEKDPANAAVRTALLLTYLGEMDDPAEAAKLLGADSEEGLKTYVPLAAKNVEELEEGVCVQLAEWLAAQAEKASAAGKGNLLARAKACCERYLAVHTAQDASALKAKMLLEKVAKGAGQGGGKTPKYLSLDVAKGVTMKLVLLPRGKFLMGCKEDEKGYAKYEGPQHEVIISRPFYMGAYLVTQAQYEAIMGKNPSDFKGPTNPVETGLWAGNAVEFCKKLSEKTKRIVRLPTEAEWEYACRAGTTTTWFFGDDDKQLGDYAWFGGNGSDMTHPVGLKKPNPWGLYDMYGNVFQWCSDFYLADYYSSSPKVDPRGPNTTSGANIRRGGAYWTGSDRCRSGWRSWSLAGYRHGDHGFRVVVQTDR
jgi:formylglycine-generating enzyme required for sulfatase activity